MSLPDTKKDENKNFSYEFIIYEFINLMNDIGRYGEEKYKEKSFIARSKNNDKSRGPLTGRTSSQAIIQHAKDHCDMYLNNELHDYFKTKKHQIAAVAFNAMMEFYFSNEE